MAQVSAKLSGLITDQSGAALPAATVAARNLDTGTSRAALTDQTGRYRLFALPPGQYEVRVTKDGFAEAIRSGIRLVVGQDASVNLSLRIGPVSQQIKV
ncbi:MAG TPA: carboxypeptidase-like regulatory domain-containing protein, partial [Terriglobales bacterium]|nr:carboxypeptidase-like regulatory domain-containing protein [Terriglobales bacterium]